MRVRVQQPGSFKSVVFVLNIKCKHYIYMSSLPPMLTAATTEDVQRLMQQADTQGQTLLLDFTAKWCGPCKAMKPVVEELSRAFAGHFLVALVDVDEADATLTDHFQVASVPMFVFIYRQKVVHIVRGKKEEELRTTGRIVATMASAVPR